MKMDSRLQREIAVQFDSVSFSYGDVTILENASFHIHRGEFAALVGPNGSGKTTALKLMLGLEQPSSGKVILFGEARGRSSAPHSRIGYVPQQPPAALSFPVTVYDVVRMGLLHPSRRYGTTVAAYTADAMEQAGIADLAAHPWAALSGGQRRRALVARALAARPELLILDEPTANMDADSEERLFETLGKLKGNSTIFIVTHDMDFVSALTDRVLCMGDTYNRRGIVQHRTEAAPPNEGGPHGGAHMVRAKILHGENVSGNTCCRTAACCGNDAYCGD
jgi:zinc transport system ATP-binding protein